MSVWYKDAFSPCPQIRREFKKKYKQQIELRNKEQLRLIEMIKRNKNKIKYTRIKKVMMYIQDMLLRLKSRFST